MTAKSKKIKVKKWSSGKKVNIPIKGKKSAKLNESVNILNFIKAVAEKNYSKADKYLTAEINSRLRQKISQFV